MNRPEVDVISKLFKSYAQVKKEQKASGLNGDEVHWMPVVRVGEMSTRQYDMQDDVQGDSGLRYPPEFGLGILTEYFDRLPVLDKDQTRQLVGFLSGASGNRRNQIINQIAEGHIRLVLFVLGNMDYSWSRLSLKDHFQEGFLGLRQAAEKYDPSRGFEFSTYACSSIDRRIRKAIQEQSWIISAPLHILYMLYRVRRYYGKELDTPEILAIANKGNKLNIQTIEDFQEEVRKAENVKVWSLDWLVSRHGSGILEETTDLNQESMEERVVVEEGVLLLREALGSLKTNQRRVIELRFGLDPDYSDPLTFEQIGGFMRMSRQYVEQIEKGALRKLNKDKKLRNYFLSN